MLTKTQRKKMKMIIEKGDTKEQVMMAQALLANRMVSCIEQAGCETDVVHKRDDEVARAVTEVARMFGVGAQWTAVYRVLVDFCGWDADVAAFCRRMNKILHGVQLTHGCNYQAIQKPLTANCILRKDFKAWRSYRPPKGDRVFPRQLFIAEKLLKLLSISAEIYD